MTYTSTYTSIIKQRLPTTNLSSGTVAMTTTSEPLSTLTVLATVPTTQTLTLERVAESSTIVSDETSTTTITISHTVTVTIPRTMTLTSTSTWVTLPIGERSD